MVLTLSQVEQMLALPLTTRKENRRAWAGERDAGNSLSCSIQRVSEAHRVEC